MSKWQENSALVAKIVQAKFSFRYTYQQIQEILEEEGHKCSTRRIREVLSDWGLPKFERDFYGELNSDNVINFIKEHLQIQPVKSKPKKKRKSHITKEILCSDPHFPFVLIDLLKYLLKQKADHLHINGDIYDFYSISRFRKYQPLNFRQEFNDTNQYLKLLSETFAEIDVTIGNHFWRLFLALADNPKVKDILHSGLVQWKPEEVITSNFPNIKVANRKVEGTDYATCFYNIAGKDFLYGHFEKSSKILGKPVQQAFEAMRKWRSVWDFDFNDIKYFAQAHTHRMLRMPIEFNEIELFETGCLCDIQEYTLQPDMKYDPPNPGFITFKQEDGQTIPDSIKLHIWK